MLLTIPWFKLGGWTIPGTTIGLHWFGVLVATGIVLGLRLAQWYGKRNGIRPEAVQDCALYSVLFGFVIGHVFALVFYFPEKLLEAPWRIFFFWEDLSSYGGVFGSVVGGWIWSRRRGVPVLPVYDCIGFGFPLGWVFGRTGCFVVHDHPGKETDFFLGVRDYEYPDLPLATRHDLGLYEVLWALGIVALFLWLSRRPRPVGLYSALVALLYAPLRFGLDFLRVTDETYGGLTPGHYSSLAALIIGVALLVYARRHPAVELPAALRVDSKQPWPPA